MTILIGWIGVDSRQPCSAYLMSDSRISWGEHHAPYDYGRKVFALQNSPDILGYCGDVLFTSLVLSQICELDSNKLLFPELASSDERSSIILRQVQEQFKSYPPQARHISYIYHFSRDNDSKFRAYKYEYEGGQWSRADEHIDVSKSSLVIHDGSGANDFYTLYNKTYNSEKSDLSNTSRNIYQCFCDFLQKTKVKSCGGPPQLVGLYNGKKFNGMSFGIIFGEATYFCGSPCSPEYAENNPAIRWYNENFEICNGTSLLREVNAMRQPNPNRP